MDEPRLLHVKSQYGYTSDAHFALHGEPEAISEAEQRSLTRQARRRENERRLAAWREARVVILAAVDTCAAVLVGHDRAIDHSLVNVRRSISAIDRRLSVRSR